VSPAVVIDAALLLLALVAALPALVLFAEVAAAVSSRPPGNAPAAAGLGSAPAAAAPDDGPGAAALARTARLAVLMPAHDEAAGIGATIASVVPQLGPHDRLLVVADNCSDDTATLARAAGAEVIERRDPERRGKGYALDFGMRWLERDAPDLVVMIDADCLLAPHALERLASRCAATARPVQALYLMQAPPGASTGQRIAAFAWLVKNKLRPLGATALGWPCQLMGTGMAFPWARIRAAQLASAHLVEDMQLGLDLAEAGAAPLFCPDALVTSTFPLDRDGSRSQRTRWEHGHLSVIAQVAPRLLGRALLRRDRLLAAMVLDLIVPPLAALVLLTGTLVLLEAVWWGLGGSAWPLAVSTVGFGLLALAVALAWRREGRAIVALRELLGLPLYVAAKIPLYLRLLTRRQVEWVRTKRDERGH
jgi:cellulose synthase/poly-beta-1,6-N-acetylglucosamine synthase-like glycosyltransferase